MILIIGLGNPGAAYRGTRHNVGFSVLELLAERHRLPFVRDRESKSALAEGQISGQNALLQMPLTYMNLSGEAVSYLVRKRQVALSKLLVVVDDAALPFGRLRFRAEGSAGGHNGLKSIEAWLQTTAYARLRVGIGNPGGEDLADYVLSPFTAEERDALPEIYERAAKAVELWIRDGVTSVIDQID